MPITRVKGTRWLDLSRTFLKGWMRNYLIFCPRAVRYYMYTQPESWPSQMLFSFLKKKSSHYSFELIKNNFFDEFVISFDQLKFRKERNANYQGMIAMDDIAFSECALPDPALSCDTSSNFWCDNRACVDQSLVCDWSDDCGDATDEDLPSCRKSWDVFPVAPSTMSTIVEKSKFFIFCPYFVSVKRASDVRLPVGHL